MRKVRLTWHGYRYFPYEKDFAIREVEALLGSSPRPIEGGLEVDMNGTPASFLKRLTYFREAELQGLPPVRTIQALLEESAHNGSRRRQSTRYSAHGLHEYRGKFNPQVVRAIGNLLGLSAGKWILDPFCGSGTTLLECAHVGWNAVGVDLNPLGTLISNAKIAAIKGDPKKLSDHLERLTDRLLKRANGLNYEGPWSSAEMRQLAGHEWESSLPNFEYLAAWFQRPVLAQIAATLEEIRSSDTDGLGIVFRVILSDLCRVASLQDPGDLRIRRRKEPEPNYPLIPMFLETSSTRVATVLRARTVLSCPQGTQLAVRADSRLPFEEIQVQLGRKRSRTFDAVITSPPYATALPYIDTQRLSLSLLGLIESADKHVLERQLIGARDISLTARRALEQLISQSSEELPSAVLQLCGKMNDLAHRPGNGFRRRNMPALVYRYFKDMARVFRNVGSVVQQGAPFALVVGRNSTVLSGKPIRIDTPQLLSDVAEACGWTLDTQLEMNTYQRFDVHRQNSITTECLIVLRRT